jgi:hypothetical protein
VVRHGADADCMEAKKPCIPERRSGEMLNWRLEYIGTSHSCRNRVGHARCALEFVYPSLDFLII